MDKKELRQQRVKNYFIEATCDIIRKEGIKGLNIRKVADAAGYHYSTIYKYFKDFPHLIAISVLQFLEEASKYITENTLSQDPVGDYINSWGAFCRYSLDNINIFNSFFLESYGDIDGSEIEGIFGQSSLFKERKDSMIQVSKVLRILPEKVMKLDNSIMSLCIGSIVLYSSGRSDFSSEEIIANNIESIRLIIDSYTSPK